MTTLNTPLSFLAQADLERMIAAAAEARSRAYVPYSNFKVGAALLTQSGQLYTGCNVENAAYPACICAERTALVKAVSEGVRDFTACVVVTRDGGSPCGLCRQMLYEFSPDMAIYMADEQLHVHHAVNLRDLLPYGFNRESLGI